MVETASFETQDVATSVDGTDAAHPGITARQSCARRRTSAARRVSVTVWYDAPLHQRSAIPGLSLRDFCHFRGTVGA